MKLSFSVKSLNSQVHAQSSVSFCCCSVTKSSLILSKPLDCSRPGFPVLHYLSRVCSNSCPLSQWCYLILSWAKVCYHTTFCFCMDFYRIRDGCDNFMIQCEMRMFCQNLINENSLKGMVSWGFYFVFLWKACKSIVHWFHSSPGGVTVWDEGKLISIHYSYWFKPPPQD